MATTRRIFLHQTIKTGFVLSSVPLLASCGAVTRSDVDTAMKAPQIENLIGQDGLDILRLASLAPNGHNTQPWTITLIDPVTWILGSDQTRWLPAVDPANREMLLSLGAFLENLIIAAEHKGYTVNVNVIARSAKELQIAELTLRKASPQTYPLERLVRRRTVKNGFLRKDISAQDVTAFCTGEPEQVYYFPHSSAQGKFLAEGTLEANRIQVYRDPAQEELADWIRWSNDEARARRDGLTPASMEIAGLAGWYVRTCYNRNHVLTEGFRETTVEKTAEHVKTHGGWLVLTSQDASVLALLDAGRRFQRLALQACDRMIAIHPMTQLIEETPEGPMQIACELGLNESVQFILRTGYLKSYPEPVSLRRPIAWFTRLA